MEGSHICIGIAAPKIEIGSGLKWKVAGIGQGIDWVGLACVGQSGPSSNDRFKGRTMKWAWHAFEQDRRKPSKPTVRECLRLCCSLVMLMFDVSLAGLAPKTLAS